MISMLPKGKKCICMKCGKKIQVLFNRNHSGISVTVNDGIAREFYFVYHGLCRNCFEKENLTDDKMKIQNCVWRIEQLINDASKIISKYKSQHYEKLIYEEFEVQYHKWLQKIRLSDIAPEVYTQIVENTSSKEKGIIKSLVNNFLQKNHAGMREWLKAGIGTEGSPIYSAILSQCNEELCQVNREFVSLRDALPNDKVIYYWRNTNIGFTETYYPDIFFGSREEAIFPDDNNHYYIYSQTAVETMPITLEYPCEIQSDIIITDQALQKDLQRIFVQELRSAVFGGYVQQYG